MANPEKQVTEKFTVEVIRDKAAALNNPQVDVEKRQRALTSLVAELCDRVLELTGALGKAVSRLTRQGDELGKQLGEVETALGDIVARGVPGPSAAVADEAATAQGVPAEDPAAVAIGMNGGAGVPVAPATTKVAGN